MRLDLIHIIMDIKCWTTNVSTDNVRIDYCINRSAKPFLQGNSSKLMEEYHPLEKLSDELRGMEKTLSLLLSSRKEEERPGHWTRLAKKVNRVFFGFYVTVVILFLTVIFLKWNGA